jgi:hypothetical protein
MLTAKSRSTRCKTCRKVSFPPKTTRMDWTGTESCPSWRLAGGEPPWKRCGLDGNKVMVMKHDVFSSISLALYVFIEG